jgi:hypothetical protein
MCSECLHFVQNKSRCLLLYIILYLMILQFVCHVDTYRLNCCDSLDRRMLLCEEVVALSCSAACNLMTSLIVNVT